MNGKGQGCPLVCQAQQYGQDMTVPFLMCLKVPVASNVNTGFVTKMDKIVAIVIIDMLQRSV